MFEVTFTVYCSPRFTVTDSSPEAVSSAKLSGRTSTVFSKTGSEGDVKVILAVTFVSNFTEGSRSKTSSSSDFEASLSHAPSASV